MGITKHSGETNAWDKATYEAFAKDVLEKGALLNNAATEPATGSPTRGGKPETVAKETADGWMINGRKSFTTLAPILDYINVSASIDGTDKDGSFLIRRELEDVSDEATWTSTAIK